MAAHFPRNIVIFEFVNLGLGFLALYVVARLLTTRYLHLRGIPGPRWAPFTRLWLLKSLASEDSANTYVQVNRKYGPLARIGPNHVLLSDPEAIKKMLSTRSRYTRGPWYDALKIDPQRANLITERDKRKHQVLRHQLAAGYAGSDIPSLEPTVDVRLEEWICYINRQGISDASNTVKFDLARSIQYLTTDIISHLCFGQPFGFTKIHGDVHGFIATLESRLPIIEKFSVLVELNALLSALSYMPLFKRYILPQATDADGLGKILGISRKVVNERFEPNAMPQNDMLGSFLSNGVAREQAESEITVSLFAGSDTTASALRGTLLYIMTSPAVYAKLKREIDLASAQGSISSPIQSAQIPSLSYLQACVKEGLRIFPPITSLRERVVPSEGDTVLGYFLPAGTNVGINMAASQLNIVFGPDPEVFRPERWLKQDAARLQEMNRVHELVFGHGATRCLGIRIATMTIHKVLVELLSRYEITVVNPMKPWNSRCHGIFLQKDFWVRIMPRES